MSLRLRAVATAFAARLVLTALPAFADGGNAAPSTAAAPNFAAAQQAIGAQE